MVEIDRDPGGSTMIRVSREVREMIEQEKIIPREPLNDCIKRGILENREHRKHPSIETREGLKTELETVVTNPRVVTCGGTEDEHVANYLRAHPGEKILDGENIHHINGNHNDNRLENLVKLPKKEHGEAHEKLHKDFPPLHATKGNLIVGKDI